MEKESEKKQLDSIKHNLVAFYNQYRAGNADLQSIKNFISDLIIYCKETRHPTCWRELPSLIFKENLNDVYNGGTTLASYFNGKNEIAVSPNYVNIILSGNKDIIDLIKTIGHEVEHYEQYSKVLDYNRASPDKQAEFDAHSLEIIKSHENDIELDIFQVRELIRLIDSNAFNELEAKSDTMQELKNIAYSTYYTRIIEKEANEEGIAFAKQFLNLVKKEKLLAVLKIRGLLETLRSMKSLKQVNSELINSEKAFRSAFTESENTLKKYLAKLSNADAKDFSSVSDPEIVKYWLKDKSLEQKLSVLKNSITNSNKKVTEICMKMIKEDLNYKRNREFVEQEVFDCLSNLLQSENLESAKGSFSIDYSPLLGYGAQRELVENAFSVDPEISTEIVMNNEPIITSEFMYDVYEKLNNNEYDYDTELFFEILLKKAECREKFYLLKFIKKQKGTYDKKIMRSIFDDKQYDEIGADVESYLGITPDLDYKKMIEENAENIYLIPKKYLTTELYDISFKKFGSSPDCLPENLQTQEMWNEFFDLEIKKYYNSPYYTLGFKDIFCFDLKAKIPQRFFTQEMENRLKKLPKGGSSFEKTDFEKTEDSNKSNGSPQSSDFCGGQPGE